MCTWCRLLVGEHVLASNMGRRRDKTMYISKVCGFCDKYVVEDVPHFVFECMSTLYVRDRLRRSLHDTGPTNLVNEMKKVSPVELATFCVSGFSCKYVPEWQGNIIYTIVCVYFQET